MTIARSFHHLAHQVRQLSDALEAMSTTVEEDRPARGDVALAGSLADALLGVRGSLQDCSAALALRGEPPATAANPEAERRALVACQDGFHRFCAQFDADLASFARIEDLASVARERGRAWAGWVGVVRQELEQCQQLIGEVREALFLCWQELSERPAGASVSVHASGVGLRLAQAG